jgi:hypothetical protein
MTLLDARARSYPLIGCFDDLLKIGIRENAFRISVPHPEDARVLLCH